METMEKKCLLITGLTEQITKKNLEKTFIKFGNISNIEINKIKEEEDVSSSIYAHIIIEAMPSDLKKCYNSLNNTSWKGGKITIQLTDDVIPVSVSKNKKSNSLNSPEKSKEMVSNKSQSSQSEDSSDYDEMKTKKRRVSYQETSDENSTDSEAETKSKEPTTFKETVEPPLPKPKENLLANSSLPLPDMSRSFESSNLKVKKALSQSKRIQSQNALRKGMENRKSIISLALSGKGSSLKNKKIMFDDNFQETSTDEPQETTEVYEDEETEWDNFDQSKDSRFNLDDRFQEDEGVEKQDPFENLSAFVRYDPSNIESQKLLINQPDKSTTDFKTRFYAVSDDLRKVLTLQQSAAEKSFSLLEAFGTNEDVEDEFEMEDEVTEETPKIDWKPVENFEENFPAEVKSIRPFFLEPDDELLKEGVAFFAWKKSKEQIEAEWPEKKYKILDFCKTKKKEAERCKEPYRRPVGRGGKRLPFNKDTKRKFYNKNE